MIIVIGARLAGLATGFRPTLDFLNDDVALDANGWPSLLGWQSSLNPQLFCVGFDYPATSKWIQAIGRLASEAVDKATQRFKLTRSRPAAIA